MRQQRFTLNAAGRAAVKAFRNAKPWQGTLIERGDKVAELHRGLCRAYDLETILTRDDTDPDAPSLESGVDLRTNRIVLRGRLSVVTYLFCFAVAAGNSPRAALAWARETFAHFFPRSFARCRDVGGVLLND